MKSKGPNYTGSGPLWYIGFFWSLDGYYSDGSPSSLQKSVSGGFDLVLAEFMSLRFWDDVSSVRMVLFFFPFAPDVEYVFLKHVSVSSLEPKNMYALS